LAYQKYKLDNRLKFFLDFPYDDRKNDPDHLLSIPYKRLFHAIQKAYGQIKITRSTHHPSSDYTVADITSSTDHTITGFLGRGVLKAVFEATDQHGKTIAIKIQTKGLLQEKSQERLSAEIESKKILGARSAGYIDRGLTLDEHGIPIRLMVCEYLNGMTLQQFFNCTESISLHTATMIMRQTLSVTCSERFNGMDLDNIMLSLNGQFTRFNESLAPYDPMYDEAEKVIKAALIEWPDWKELIDVSARAFAIIEIEQYKDYTLTQLKDAYISEMKKANDMPDSLGTLTAFQPNKAKTEKIILANGIKQLIVSKTIFQKLHNMLPFYERKQFVAYVRAQLKDPSLVPADIDVTKPPLPEINHTLVEAMTTI